MITVVFPEWMGYLFAISASLYVIQNMLQFYIWWLKKQLKKLEDQKRMTQQQAHYELTARHRVPEPDIDHKTWWRKFKFWIFGK